MLVESLTYSWDKRRLRGYVHDLMALSCVSDQFCPFRLLLSILVWGRIRGNQGLALCCDVHYYKSMFFLCFKLIFDVFSNFFWQESKSASKRQWKLFGCLPQAKVKWKWQMTVHNSLAHLCQNNPRVGEHCISVTNTHVSCGRPTEKHTLFWMSSGYWQEFWVAPKPGLSHPVNHAVSSHHCN